VLTWAGANGEQHSLSAPLVGGPVAVGALAARMGTALRDLSAQWAARHGQGPVQLNVAISEVWLAAAVQPWSLQDSTWTGQVRHWRAGLREAGWPVSEDDVVVAQDAPHGQARLVVAIDAAVLAALSAWTTSLGWTLRTVLPWGEALLCAAAGQAQPGVLVLRDEATVLLYRHDSRVRDVVALPAPTGQAQDNMWGEPVHQALRRLQLRSPAWAAATRLHGLSTSDMHPVHLPGCEAWPHATLAATAWPRSDLDAWSPPLPGWRAAWMAALAWVAGALAALAVGLWGGGPLASFPQANVATVPGLIGPASGPTAAPDAAPAAAAEAKRLQAVNRAVAVLNLPAGDVMQAVQPPRDLAVVLTRLELAAVAPRQTLRLTADAQEPADMFRYVEHLSRQSVLATARLTQHDRVPSPTGAGATAWRFTVEATWQP
jgi:hypothetical protein